MPPPISDVSDVSSTHRIRTPAPDADDAPTVADLAERYLREYVAVRCKPATLERYRQLIDRHVVPMLGALPVAGVGRAQVAELHYRLRRTPVAANDAVGALSRMLNRADAWGMVPAGSNPCRQVRRYRTRRIERFLTETEFRRLGETLDALEGEGRVPVHAAAALRLFSSAVRPSSTRDDCVAPFGAARAPVLAPDEPHAYNGRALVRYR